MKSTIDKYYKKEFERTIELLKAEGRFWDAINDFGFDCKQHVFSDMHSIKHRELKISCCFSTLKNLLHIYRYTDLVTGGWVFPAAGLYTSKEGSFIAPCAQLIQIMEPEVFLAMLQARVVKLATETLIKAQGVKYFKI